MEITIVAWILLVIVSGIIGAKREIDWGLPVVLSLFLTPIIGLTVALNSQRLVEKHFQENVSKNQERIIKMLTTLHNMQKEKSAE